MAFELSTNTENALARTDIRPQYVFVIDGIDSVFGAVEVTSFIRIGDPGLFIDGSWVIGGIREIANSESLISLEGTSTSINQQMRPDQGNVSSVSSMTIRLVDLNQTVTEIISPGFEIEDVLFRRGEFYVGFQGTSYPEDFVLAFAGVIDDIQAGAGYIDIQLAHPDQKKRQQIFKKGTTKLNGSIGTGVGSITVDSTSDFLEPYTGTPTGLEDPSLQFYVRIDDEIMRYDAKTDTTFNITERGALNTIAVTHDDDATVDSFYQLEDNSVDMALKIMMSGMNGNWKSGIEVEAFNQISASLTVTNAIFFQGVNVEQKYGIVAGDFITTTGAANGANNVTLKAISEVAVIDEGSYLVIDDVTFVDETDSAAVVAFRSQYDVLGEGLKMTPQDVDVAEHMRWQTYVLSQYQQRFFLKDTIDGKEFIEKKIYLPTGAYAVPRKAKCSLGYHLGPIADNPFITIDKESVKNASKIVLRRTTNRHFENTVIYKFDEDSIEDKFLGGAIVTDEDSKNRIEIGTKATIIEANGFRTDLNGDNLAILSSQRRLARYKFAAEHFERIDTFFKKGFAAEIGDIILIDFEGLQVSNTRDGNRNRATKFYEIINKKIDLKTGDVQLNVVDTNFEEGERYGVISPSSEVGVGSDSSGIIIIDSFGAKYPGNEKKKWESYFDLPILVHSEDFSFSETTTLLGFDPNNRYRMLIDPPLSVPAVAGYVVDIVEYDNTDADTNRLYKLVHPHWSPTVAVTSGVSGTSFNVSAPNAAKFTVGLTVQVHTPTFSQSSEETKVASVVGTLITVEDDLGFTPSSSHVVNFIGFDGGDDGEAYRWL